MSEYLLVVEGLAESGADAALFVSESTYRAAMFGCAFAEPVHGYVWCDTHGWVLADEVCVCEECAYSVYTDEALARDLAYVGEIDAKIEASETAWLRTFEARANYCCW